MSAQEILKLIESIPGPGRQVAEVDNRLDEIDARVWCWLNGHKFISCWRKHPEGCEIHNSYNCVKVQSDSGDGKPYNWFLDEHYTRSRDALKGIRPEGWFVHVVSPHALKEFHAVAFKSKPYVLPFTMLLPTEELAELHAIIQAITYERCRE